MTVPRTLYQKLVDAHTVQRLGEGEVLLAIDLHIMNEYTSPQAFSGLADSQRPVWRPACLLYTSPSPRD